MCILGFLFPLFRKFFAKVVLSFVIKGKRGIGKEFLLPIAEEWKEKAEYAKKVGQLTMQVDWLKKKSEEIVGPDYESKFSPKPFDD